MRAAQSRERRRTASLRTPNALRLAGWIGWAGVDAIGRLALLAGSTIVFSRLLSPRDFGVAALVLTTVSVASVFVGAPFEEALAQRRVMRRGHFEAALAASWLVGLVLLGLSVISGWLLARAYAEPEMRLLLPVATLSIFFNGHSDIVAALARRLRRFNDLAFANLTGHAIGIALALVIAAAGGDIWALIAQRVLVVVVRDIVLNWRIGFVIAPRWSTSYLSDLSRFARFSFFDRLLDNVAYLVFSTVVGALYGVTALGHVNMAMRLIEPIRGAVMATGHNLAFSFFAVVGHDQIGVRNRAEKVVSGTAFILAPAFIGFATVIPVMLPLIAGPGWDEAVDIAICLSIGSAIAVPARLIYTALSASARPEYSLFSSGFAFAATLLVLACATSLGPISIGLSRLVGDVVQAVLAVSLTSQQLVWSRSGRLGALLPAWLTAGTMGLIIAGTGIPLAVMGRFPALLASGTLGVGVYVALLCLFAPISLRDLLAMLMSRRRLTVTTTLR